MMKTLYLDCGMGAAGDMLAAALLELLPDPDGFVQTLNGSGLATSRVFPALFEQFQLAYGSIRIPDVLAPSMGGQTKLERR